MSSTWDRRPLITVAATDLILAAVFGSPWVTEWALSGRTDDSLAKHGVEALLFPGWGAGDNWELALWSEHWRAGAFLRILAFLLLHLWVVAQFARRTTRGGSPAWRGVRTGAWVFAPGAGALAGLATVASGAFDTSTTVEVRDALRIIAIESIADGAYWGLFAGAVCWIVLTISSRFAYRPRAAASAESDDGADPEPRLLGCLPLASGFAIVATAAVVAVVGGPAIVGDNQVTQEEPSAGDRLADLVSYLRWWNPDQSDGSSDQFSYVPRVALAVYLLVLLSVLMTNLGESVGRRQRRQRRYPPTLPMSNPDALATSPGLVAFAKGWHAAMWAAIVAAVVAAELKAVISVFSGSGYALGESSGIRVLVSEFLDELPKAAAYIALLGWVPALAVLAAARVLRWLLGVLDEMEESEKSGAAAQSDTDLPPADAQSEQQERRGNIVGLIVCLVLAGTSISSASTTRQAATPCVPQASRSSTGPAQSSGQTFTMTKFVPPCVRQAAKYNITIPVLQDPSNPAAAHRVNTDLQSVVATKTQRMIAAAERNGFDDDKLYLTSHAGILDANLYSVEMKINIGGPAHAHPAEDLITRNYRLQDGRPLSMSDLFSAPSSSSYPGFIRLRTIKQLKGRMFDDAIFRLREIDLNAHYLIGRDHLRFVFFPCEIGPCVAGYLESRISYRDLAEYIDPKGPLGALL